MVTVARPVRPVIRAQRVRGAVDGERESAPLHDEVLPRAAPVGREDSGVHSRRDGRAHNLKFNAGQHGGEDPALPARGVARHALGRVARDDNARGALLAEKSRDAGVESGGDAIEDEDGRHLPPRSMVESMQRLTSARSAAPTSKRPGRDALPGPSARTPSGRAPSRAASVMATVARVTPWWMIFRYERRRQPRVFAATV